MAKFINLEKVGNSSIIESEICIIGAGPIGIFTAYNLANAGIKTILIEAGNKETKSGIDFMGKPITTKLEYSGATLGRFFGLGGSSSNWGGVLIPHDLTDLENKTENIKSWEWIIDIIKCNKKDVLRKLNFEDDFEFIDEKKYNFSDINNDLLIDKKSLALPFSKRNFYSFFYNAFAKFNNLKIIYNAVADIDELDFFKTDTTIKSFIAKSKNGNQAKIISNKFIITCGALESCRILLIAKDKFRETKLKLSSRIGKLLSDHISVPIARVNNISRTQVIKQFAPKFLKSWIISKRFSLSTKQILNKRCFFHFVFPNNSNGFKSLKKFLISKQSEKLDLKGYFSLINTSKEIFNYAYYFFFKKRIFIPQTCNIKLQIDFESNNNNFVELSNEKDDFGRKKLKINWSITNDDFIFFKKIKALFFENWQKSDFSDIILEPINLELKDFLDAKNYYDAYHPAGLNPIILDSNESVLSRELKVKGFSNCYLVSTGNLPSVGSANPTFSALCLSNYLTKNLLK